MRLPDLLPQLSFSLDGTVRTFDVDLDVEFTLTHLVFGSMVSVGGEVHGLWQAQHLGSNEFLRQEELPDGQRPWSAGERRGYGWAIDLPAFLAADPDPVLRQRAALAIEALLYSLAAGREIELPYRRRISNVFEAQRPTWKVDLPLVRTYIS